MILIKHLCCFSVSFRTGIEADIAAYIDGATNSPPSVHADREVK